MIQAVHAERADAPAPQPHARHLTRVRLAGWVAAVCFGLVHAWMYRFDIRDVDGVSYLDMGDAYVRGDWGTALNGYWSPLYSWLLGLALWLLRPSPVWEYPTTQLVNVVVYVGALACFDYFLRELTRSDRARTDKEDQGAPGLPPWALVAIGYSLFVWAALYWHFFWLQTPDLVVAALVFVGAALLLRIRRGETTWRTFVGLGAVLGLAFLAKAAMFLLAFVFLAVGVAAVGDVRRALPRGLAALATFLLVASPLVVALSTAKGRFTFGDSGRLNYAWFVNHLRPGPDWRHMPHWRGGSDFGVPTHPARQIFEHPVAYEFATPVGGTYPLWYDPSYWHEGLQLRFEADLQRTRLLKSARFYFDFFTDSPQPGLFVAAVVLYTVARRRALVHDVLRHWVLLVPGVAALGLYAVVWVEGRYIAPFVVLGWLGVLAGARSPRGPGMEQLARGVTVGLTSLTLGLAALRTAHDLVQRPDPNNSGRFHARVAAGLAESGVQHGDRVAIVGSWLTAMRWARLARARIVAEVPWSEADAFWKADPLTQSRVIDALCATGAEVIVTHNLPREQPMAGWTRIKGARRFAFVRCGTARPAS